MCHRSRLTRYCTTAVLLPCIIACATQPEPPVIPVALPLRIDNLTIIDPTDGSRQPAMSILMRDGMIAAVLPTDDVRAGPPITTIDGAGRFAVPGYNNLHSHAIIAERSELLLATMLAEGVTRRSRQSHRDYTCTPAAHAPARWRQSSRHTTGGGLPPRLPERGSDATEGPGCAGVEGERVEVWLRLLKMRLSRRARLIGRRDQRSHGQLDERDRGDQRFIGKQCGVVQSTEHDDRAGVEDAARVTHPTDQGEASVTRSRSARSCCASTGGRRRHRCSNVAAVSARPGSGRSSAMGWPSMVTVSVSPPATRCRTRPP